MLTDSVLWVFRTDRARGFHPSYWPVEFAAWMTVADHSLAPTTSTTLTPLYR